MTTANLVTFADSVQRTIIAELVSETQNEIIVKNPLVVNIVPKYDIDPATGQPVQGREPKMALQLLPLFFKEFLAVPEDDVIFTYPKSLVTTITFKNGFDFKVYAHYNNITKVPLIKDEAADGSEVNPSIPFKPSV